jgi:hypothetical protein
MSLIVTFKTDVQRAVALIDYIKSLGEWGVLTPTSYLVGTTASPGRVMEKLQPLLGPDDDLWVFSVRSPWAGYGNVEAEDVAVGQLGKFADWVPRDWDEARQSRL